VIRILGIDNNLETGVLFKSTVFINWQFKLTSGGVVELVARLPRLIFKKTFLMGTMKRLSTSIGVMDTH
jgi:hypothetical protein